MTELDLTKSCRVCQNRYRGSRYCGLTRKANGRDAITGEIRTDISTCNWARSEYGPCGPTGKYWVKDPFWVWHDSVNWRAVKVGVASIIMFFILVLVGIVYL